MYFDLKQLLLVVGQWLMACVFLAVEQSFSLPFLFFVMSLISVRQQPKGYRELLLLLLGISLASLYNLWLGVGVIWIFGLLGISYAVGHFLPALRVRITLASLLGTLLLAQVSGQEITGSKMILLGISIVGFWVFSLFVRWDVRSVALPKAHWGWQKV